MRDYRDMSPCERVRYYRQRLTELVSTRRNRIGVLQGTFKKLIEENLRECPSEVEQQIRTHDLS